MEHSSDWRSSSFGILLNAHSVGVLQERLARQVHGKLELLLGIDTGTILAKLASRRPSDLFIGVEVKNEKCLAATLRLRRFNANNAIVVNMEAQQFVSEALQDGIADAIHAYFPTPSPWFLGIDHPNLKCRLVNRNSVREWRRVLRLMGTANLITDVRDYFDEMAAAFPSTGWQQLEWRPIDQITPKGMLVGTPTERGLRKRGCTRFHALRMAKA